MVHIFEFQLVFKAVSCADLTPVATHVVSVVTAPAIVFLLSLFLRAVYCDLRILVFSCCYYCCPYLLYTLSLFFLHLLLILVPYMQDTKVVVCRTQTLNMESSLAIVPLVQGQL